MYDQQAARRFHKEKLEQQDDVAKKLQLAKNIRLADPPGFAHNTIICGALFFEIKIHVTVASIQNLLVLSQHPTISHFVRRVVFIQPQFQDKLGDNFKNYEFEIKTAVDDKVNRITQATIRRNRNEDEWAFSRRRGQFYRNKKAEMTPTREQFDSGFQVYQRGWREQGDLLRTSYVRSVATALSRFSQLSSVHISMDPDGDLFQFLDWKDTKQMWITRTFPDVLIEQKSLVRRRTGPVDLGDNFVYNVLDALNKAGIQPRELRFIHSHGLGCRFDWGRVGSLDFLSKLRILQINVRGAGTQLHDLRYSKNHNFWTRSYSLIWTRTVLSK